MKKYIIAMAGLGVIEICLALYLTFWRHTFWDFVVAKNLGGFTQYLIIFTIVALFLCVVTACAGYVSSLAAIKWRRQLNKKAVAHIDVEIENVNQRIQQDCSEYPTLVLTVGFGLVKAVAYLVVFAVTLVYEFNYIYLLIIASYAIIATYIAKLIGFPLIALNYKSQQVEATYRNNLNKDNFLACIIVQLDLAKKLKHLNYFQVLYSQLGVIVPLIIIAPAYFAGKMLVGALMQAMSLMSTVVDNLSFGVNSFKDINRLISCRKRLKEINIL